MNKIIENLDFTKGYWFPLACGIISLLIVIFMPKRLKWREIYITFGVVGFVALLMDVYIMGGIIDVFDLGDAAKEGIGDIMSYGVVAPSLAIIFLNFYKSEKKWICAGIFILISFLFEWLLVQVGYMKLKGWKSLYSIPVYILVYGVWLPWHLKLIRKQ